MTVAAYSARMRSLVSPTPVWQVVPPRTEHIRELLTEAGGLVAVAGSHPGYKDHGGSTLKTPKLVLIDFGPWWGDVSKRNQFARELMEFGYLSKLGAYGSGNGTYLGTWQGPAFSGNVTDAQIQDAIKALIAAGTVPQPDGETLYAACLPDGVHVIVNGAQGDCSQYCGYHGAIDERTFYTVQPSTLCGPCHGDVEPFVAFCMVLAHEVAEACTDAVVGRGWFVDDPSDSMNGSENSDLEAWIPVPYGPWTVQGYYTNEEGNTVGTYTPTRSAAKLQFLAPPATAVFKTPITLAVAAEDASNSIVPNFGGVVSFSSSDPAAVLPGPYQFMPVDSGVHRFSLSFATPGAQTIRVSTPAGLAATASVTVFGPDYSRVLPLLAWVLQNFGGKFIDVCEQLDADPNHDTVFERWRQAMQGWGLI